MLTWNKLTSNISIGNKAMLNSRKPKWGQCRVSDRNHEKPHQYNKEVELTHFSGYKPNMSIGESDKMVLM